MTGWLVAAVVAGIVLCLIFRPARRFSKQQAQSGVSSMSARSTAIEVAVRRPKLPDGVEEGIVSALRAGKEPSDEWTGKGLSNDEIKTLPSCFFQSVAGESFANPDGISRQSIIATTEPGTVVWLVPEPDNAYDLDAVRVFVDWGDGNTGQIGYLPRDHNLGGDITSGNVAAWFAKSRKSDGGLFGAILYVVTT
jgi:hypothetical protein